MSVESEVAETTEVVEPEPAHHHRPIDQYASAADRARDVHIRDVETEPRWNGHAPVPATAQSAEMGTTEMVVCQHCGAVSQTRPEMADQRRCPE